MIRCYRSLPLHIFYDEHLQNLDSCRGRTLSHNK
nr:MAG TPA: hypothetical protein [Caudoviricetes sp.]